MKSGENCTGSFKEDIKKLHNLIPVYSLGARADDLWGQNFNCY